MPFMKGGRSAVTRTKKYLASGRILLNDDVKVMAIHHVPGKKSSQGCDELIKWFLPPLQFKNPNVQIITLKNMCPTPYIHVFLSDHQEILIDCSFRKHTDIHDHLAALLGRQSHSSSNLGTDDECSINPANFGTEYPRQCICEIYGQVPCPSQVGRPKLWPSSEPGLPVVEGLTDVDSAPSDSDKTAC
ncbi:unnamed protein product [Calicophoron daubneyi]|uniref:Small ribosomal subunit protein mS25 n=1 Tax=Calicophoron daubneyi TaxID=300641 RepID=A0AAV2TMN9_CALDB